MSGDKLEDDEAHPRASSEAGVHQPKGGRWHRLVETADFTDHRVGREDFAGGSQRPDRSEERSVSTQNPVACSPVQTNR